MKFKFVSREKDSGDFEVEVLTDACNKTVYHQKILVEGKEIISQKCQEVRGPERHIRANDLETEGVYPYRAKEINACGSKALIKEGIVTVPSPATLRMVNYQRKIEGRRHKDPWLDLNMLRENHTDFIRTMTMPLSVHCFYNPTLSAFNSLKKDIETVYFDASGSTCRHPNKKNKGGEKVKKVLFYVTVGKIGRHLVPLQCLITEDHSAFNIGQHLEKFKLTCRVLKIWPLFRRVMMDNSTALQLAANRSYNGFINAISYLKFCWKILSECIPLPKDHIVIQSCISHFAKVVALDIRRFMRKKEVKITKEVRRIIQECMAFGTTLPTLDDVMMWWTLFCLIFNSKYESEQTLNALREMQKLKVLEPTGFDVEEQNFKEVEALKTVSPSIYRNSPFFKLFSKIKTTLEVKEIPGNKINPYFVVGLADHYLKKFMFNVPFWTNIMGYLLGLEKSSDQTAEAFFKVFKFHLCKNQKNLKISNFVELLMTQTNTALHDADIQNGGAVCNKRKATENIEELQTYEHIEELQTEKWNKKTKKRNSHTYYMGKQLASAIEKLE